MALRAIGQPIDPLREILGDYITSDLVLVGCQHCLAHVAVARTDLEKRGLLIAAKVAVEEFNVARNDEHIADLAYDLLSPGRLLIVDFGPVFVRWVIQILTESLIVPRLI